MIWHYSTRKNDKLLFENYVIIMRTNAISKYFVVILQILELIQSNRIFLKNHKIK